MEFLRIGCFNLCMIVSSETALRKIMEYTSRISPMLGAIVGSDRCFVVEPQSGNWEFWFRSWFRGGPCKADYANRGSPFVTAEVQAQLGVVWPFYGANCPAGPSKNYRVRPAGFGAHGLSI